MMKRWTSRSLTHKSKDVFQLRSGISHENLASNLKHAEYVKCTPDLKTLLVKKNLINNSYVKNWNDILDIQG